MKLLKAILFGLFCAIFGWGFGRYCGVEPQVKDKLPSLIDIQRQIGAKPDGIYGRETKEMWDRAVGNQIAKQWDWMYLEVEVEK